MLERVLFPESRAFIEICMLILVTLAIRGFVQVYRPTIRAGKIRVTNVFGKEFWMPLWWRPFTMVTTLGFGAADLAYLAVLVFSQ